jgi:peptidoglycan/xylan/chitin deacetylase (PgdA/CDA1 family)
MTRILIKRMLGRLASVRRRNSIRKIVLIYHSIGSGPWALAERSFGSQVEWLARNARLTSLTQLLEQDLRDPVQVAITFDDGYANLHDLALPILKQHAAVATVFVNTDSIAGEMRRPSDSRLGYYPGELFLSWRDVLRLSEAGWSIGSHGERHLDLTAADDETARRELANSKSTIESTVLLPCRIFSYTWGRHTPRLRRLVAEAGYQYGFSGRHGPMKADSDAFAIPRINVHNEYAIDDFKAITRGDWDYIGWIQKVYAGL